MNLREEFNKRSAEIELYFEILKTIELDKPKVVSYDLITTQEIEIGFDNQRVNIFRASAFLLLYNLIESTVFNAVLSIFDAIGSDKYQPKLKYKDVIDDVKKYWLNNVYKHDDRIKKETVVNSFFEISNRIFNESLQLASLYLKYGGSLDANKIKETAVSLGIKIDKLENGYNAQLHGEAFKQVKEKRNWLAHGEKTFAEIGQDYPFERLNEWKNYVFEHLEKFIRSTEDYVNNEDFLYKMPSSAVLP